MNKETVILDSLKEESDKISTEHNRHSSLLRASVPNYDLTGWNNESSHFRTVSETEKHPKPGKIKSSNQSVDTLMNKNQSPSESLINQRRCSYFIKKSITPAFFQLNKVLFDHSRLPTAYSSKKNYPEIKLLSKRNSSFLKKKPTSHRPLKTNLNNLEEMLKPDKKNPITSAVVPKLKSRSEIYRSYSKKSDKKKTNFSYFDSNFDSLVVCAKSFNPN